MYIHTYILYIQTVRSKKFEIDCMFPIHNKVTRVSLIINVSYFFVFLVVLFFSFIYLPVIYLSLLIFFFYFIFPSFYYLFKSNSYIVIIIIIITSLLLLLLIYITRSSGRAQYSCQNSVYQILITFNITRLSGRI